MSLMDSVGTVVSSFRDDYKRLIKEYNDNHKYCPNCGNDKLSSTYVMYIMNIEKPEAYKDENSCTCKCGWLGITHDLVTRN